MLQEIARTRPKLTNLIVGEGVSPWWATVFYKRSAADSFQEVCFVCSDNQRHYRLFLLDCPKLESLLPKSVVRKTALAGYGKDGQSIQKKGKMTFGGFVLLVVIGLIVFAVIAAQKEKKEIALMPPAEREVYVKTKAIRQEEARLSLYHGGRNVHIVCSQCQTKGQVRTKYVVQKVGVSGAKATGAILTGGLSLFATGLSRKQQVTVAWCGHCGSTWQF